MSHPRKCPLKEEYPFIERVLSTEIFPSQRVSFQGRMSRPRSLLSGQIVPSESISFRGECPFLECVISGENVPF